MENKDQKYIDKLVENVLNEEINKKSEKLSNRLLEQLKGGQKKLDVAEPKGKLTSADFEKLRQSKGKKKEVDEYYPDKGKMFGSFDDKHGWYDETDTRYGGEFDFDYDEEDFNEFEPFYEKHGENQRWFGPGKEGKKFFDYYKERYNKPFKIRTRKDVEESETEEGNEFSGARQDAIDSGKKEFEVGGKTYPVKEAKEKVCPKCGMKNCKCKHTKNKKSKIKEGVKTVELTESELVDLIEKIVIEEQDKVKTNIKQNKPVGLRQTEKILSKNKSENNEGSKETTKKMNDYLKDGSKGKYETNPKDFPKGNGELGEMKKKAYKASDAVEEYIENFAYPGLENNHYDEIKPNEEWLENNIKGSSKTGNNPKWANAVETELGEKINQKRKKNLYDKEKQRSYRRVTQPVDTAGENDGEGSLDKMFAKLESTEDKKNKIISEEMNRMKNLFNYTTKTQ